jgi:nitrite reductase/ring-hydroxylating ferredoxin subunit
LRRRVRLPGAASVAEGTGRKVRIPREGAPPLEILICRVAGRLRALDTLCPHEGGRLNEGPLAEGRHAVCPLHLFHFDPKDGSCVDVDCAPAKVYRIEEDGGDAWLELP